jgi:glycine betaine/choline ABC-type transport system substrate-binding protein
MTEDTALFDKIQNLKNIVDVYKCPTEEELEAALLEYIGGGSVDVAPAKEPAKAEPTQEMNKVADEFTKRFKEIVGGEPETSVSPDDLPF